jgi:hypothetical protein
MQRINENTYIDDSLVTCAEYQLFINEMLEQGKYYQPDHWSSFRFLTGQAREPIRGVRHSDAVAFCEWLTQREDREWKYRLPTQDEASVFSVDFNRGPIGYWTIETDSRLQFAWIVPLQMKSIAPNLFFRLERALELSTERFARQYTSLSRARVQELREDITGELTQAHFLGIDFDISRVGALALDRSLERVLNRSIALISTVDRLHDVDRILSCALDRSLVLDRSADRDIIVHIFANMLILKERIFGDDEASEGIRLVKERIR